MFDRRAYDLGRDLFDQLLEEQDFFHRGSKMEAIVDSYILSCKQTSKNRSKNTIKGKASLSTHMTN